MVFKTLKKSSGLEHGPRGERREAALAIAKGGAGPWKLCHEDLGTVQSATALGGFLSFPQASQLRDLGVISLCG